MLRTAFRDTLEVFKSEFDNVLEKLKEVDGTQPPAPAQTSSHLQGGHLDSILTWR